MCNIKNTISEIKAEVEDVYKECLDENWDSYGAKAISEKVREQALFFINSMPEDIGYVDVTPEPDGCICFSFFCGKDAGNSLDISLDGSSKAQAIHIPRSVHTGFVDDRVKSDILDLINNKFTFNSLFFFLNRLKEINNY